MTRVAVLDDYQKTAHLLADWESLGPTVTVDFFHEHLGGLKQVVDALQPYDVLVLMRERTALPAPVVGALPNLKLIVTTGMANASVDVEVATARHVTVSGTQGFGPETAEHAFLLIATLVNGFLTDVEGVRRGEWQSGLGRRLQGSKLGLLGLGNLGSAIARYAQAFGMELSAWSENLTDARAEQHGVTCVGSMEELFERSDVVSIHLKLSDRTRGLVTARHLELLGPDGYLVNTSRGPIVVEDDLVAALENGTIAGAALDTFDIEPLPLDHPLRTLPRALVTPHTAYASREAYTQMYAEVLEDITAWLSGSPIRRMN